jgi:hypothetical protein
VWAHEFDVTEDELSTESISEMATFPTAGSPLTRLHELIAQ